MKSALVVLCLPALAFMPMALHASKFTNQGTYVQLAEDDSASDSSYPEASTDDDIPGNRPVSSGGRGDTPYPAPSAQGIDVEPSSITPRGGGSYSKSDTCCSSAD